MAFVQMDQSFTVYVGYFQLSAWSGPLNSKHIIDFSCVYDRMQQLQSNVHVISGLKTTHATIVSWMFRYHRCTIHSNTF